MNEIDWSKAPADATHYIAESDSMFECWLKPGYAVRVSRGTSDWVRSDYADGLIADCATARRSSPSWSGEGLPPVGVVCEAKWGRTGWSRCVVFAHKPNANGGTDVLVDVDGDWTFFDKPSMFRPIRTPEQIAADERESAVNAMVTACPYPGSTSTHLDCAAIYDAGYRKP